MRNTEANEAILTTIEKAGPLRKSNRRLARRARRAGASESKDTGDTEEEKQLSILIIL